MKLLLNKQIPTVRCDTEFKLSVDLRIIEKPSKHLKAGLHRHASETPFKWRFAGEPMVV